MSKPQQNTGAIKYDQDKPRIDLVEAEYILGTAAVMTMGAAKYGAHNWKQNLEIERIYSAAMRHLLAFWKGEVIDPESGLSHLYHASANLMFLDHYIRMQQESK